MTTYKFKRYSVDEIAIESELTDIEEVRILAVEAEDNEWIKDPDPMIDDGVVIE